MKNEESEFLVTAREVIEPLVKNGFGDEVKKLIIKHGGTELSSIPEESKATFFADVEMLLSVYKHLNSQERLMKAAQKFAISFDQNRKWTDDITRMSYMLNTWKELALAAVEFSQKLSKK